MKIQILTVMLCCFACTATQAQTRMVYKVSMEDPASHNYHVTLQCKNSKKKDLDFNMCAWTPGFYEIVDFFKAVSNFHATDSSGKELTWRKQGDNIWHVNSQGNTAINLSYDVKAVVPFIGNVNLDEHYGYIIPGAVFMYLKEELQNPVTLQVQPYSGWPQFVATGLDSLPGKSNTFYAANFDILYDSPLLMGNLDIFPTVTVNGIPHQFIGYNLGDVDRTLFMNDVKKIVSSGSSIIGDIPYSHYTFIGVGADFGGFGGIEHLNSVSIIMTNKDLLAPGLKEAFYDFLAHEYFHLYNVKRIRPIELGPFDYSKENYTNLLWLSEGITDYYAFITIRKAGLVDDQYILDGIRDHITGYENKPGHLYQSATAASRSIWAIRGNPFRRTEDEVNRTISVYDKGCVLGAMIDFKIRHETGNKHSLQDVMRYLYKTYYQEKKRGFTDKEFQLACEHFAGVPLNEVFSYASTVKAIDYPKYFAYAGLTIDTTHQQYPGNDLGITASLRKDSSIRVQETAWLSPAWNAGLKQGDQILTVNGLKASIESFNHALVKTDAKQLELHIIRDKKEQTLQLKLTPWYTKTFNIKKAEKPGALEAAIYNSWLEH